MRPFMQQSPGLRARAPKAVRPRADSQLRRGRPAAPKDVPARFETDQLVALSRLSERPLRLPARSADPRAPPERSAAPSKETHLMPRNAVLRHFCRQRQTHPFTACCRTPIAPHSGAVPSIRRFQAWRTRRNFRYRQPDCACGLQPLGALTRHRVHPRP